MAGLGGGRGRSAERASLKAAKARSALHLSLGSCLRITGAPPCRNKRNFKPVSSYHLYRSAAGLWPEQLPLPFRRPPAFYALLRPGALSPDLSIGVDA
jgi:hypothetical protein